MATTEERLKDAGDFVDSGIATLKSGSKLTATEWDDRLAKSADLVAGEDGVVRKVVVEWIERSTRSGIGTLDTTFDAAALLPEAIDIGTIRELVSFLLTLWGMIKNRG